MLIDIQDNTDAVRNILRVVLGRFCLLTHMSVAKLMLSNVDRLDQCFSTDDL
jgi:hypothetical protein